MLVRGGEEHDGDDGHTAVHLDEALGAVTPLRPALLCTGDSDGRQPATAEGEWQRRPRPAHRGEEPGEAARLGQHAGGLQEQHAVGRAHRRRVAVVSVVQRAARPERRAADDDARRVEVRALLEAVLDQVGLRVGFGRIIALCYRSSTLSQVH